MESGEKMRSVVLASESPRRRELMNISGIPFYTQAAKIDETFNANLSIEEGVMDLALRKAMKVSETRPNEVVIGADTIVVIDNEILGKPKDVEDAYRMLRLLSNKTHRVITGVAIVNQDVKKTFYEVTEVKFANLSEETIEWYIKSREYYDKAGGYAIQGKGMILVERIHGDYFNVVGMPMHHLVEELKAFIHI